MTKKKDPFDPEDPEGLEKEIDELPLDLGEKESRPEVYGIPRFGNSDLVDLYEEPFGLPEKEALSRLVPSEFLEEAMTDSGELRDQVFSKLHLLALTTLALFESRRILESNGGDCSQDLDYSILSIIGEMASLRLVVPRLDSDS